MHSRPFAVRTDRKRAPTGRRRLYVGMIALGIASVLAVWPAAATELFAQAEITDVRIGFDPDGSDAAPRFEAPSGAERVFLRYDYAGATRTRSQATVRVQWAGLTLLEDGPTRLDGEGTEVVEIGGSEIARRAATSIEDNANSILAEIDALTNDDGATAGQVGESITSVQRAVASSANGLEILRNVGSPGNLATGVKDAGASLDELGDALEDILTIPFDEVENRRQAVIELRPLASELAGTSEALASDVSGITDLPLPNLGEDLPYVGGVYLTEGTVRDSLTGSVEFGVAASGSGGPVDDPDRSNAPRPTATTASGGGQNTGGADGGARRTATRPPTSGSGDPGDGSDDDSEDAERSDRSAGSQLDEAALAATDVASRLTPPTAAEARQTRQARIASVTGEERTESEASGADDEDAFGDPNALSDEDGDGSDMVSEAQSPEGSEDPDAMATWTPSPGGGSGSGSDPSQTESEDDAPGGPNLGALTLGVLVLVGAALWFRRRM